jgi:hypothetical protein
VNPRARCDGWNFDPRWHEESYEWIGDKYVSSPAMSQKGQRPIVIYQGLPGDRVSLQFIESSSKIVGE